jgi:hypothetical protein
MTAEDTKSIAFHILGKMDEVEALELIRAATNRVHAVIHSGDNRAYLRWEDDLGIDDASVLMLTMWSEAKTSGLFHFPN